MAAPSFVFTIAYVAKRLRVDLEVIDQLAEDMEPEDGRLSVIDSMDESAPAVTAFTPDGMQYLEQMLDERRIKFMSDI